jgi:hypothetical protein
MLCIAKCYAIISLGRDVFFFLFFSQQQTPMKGN